MMVLQSLRKKLIWKIEPLVGRAMETLIRFWANTYMDQFEYFTVKDDYGNTVYVSMSYYTEHPGSFGCECPDDVSADPTVDARPGAEMAVSSVGSEIMIPRKFVQEWVDEQRRAFLAVLGRSECTEATQTGQPDKHDPPHDIGHTS